MQNVEGGVVIPIQHQPAFRAFVGAYGKRLQLALTPTPAAYLTRSTRVHGDHNAPSTFSLGVEDCDELTPPGVVNAFSHLRLGESLDVQIFNGNQIVLPHQPECGLEMEVAPCSLDLSMFAGENTNHLPASIASPPSLTDSPLCALQHDFGNSKVSRVRDSRSVAERGELRESNVNADGFTGSEKRLHRNIVTTDRNPPIAAPVPSKRDRFYPAFNRAREEKTNCSDTAKRYAPSIDLEAALPEVGDAIVATSRFEARVPTTPEESRKRTINASDHIAKRMGWNNGNVCAVTSNLRQLSCLIETTDALPAHAPRFTPFLQCRVVKLTTQGQLRFSISRNRRREFRLVFERLTHTSI
jgi:hypothetical protein